MKIIAPADINGQRATYNVGGGSLQEIATNLATDVGLAVLDHTMLTADQSNQADQSIEAALAANVGDSTDPVATVDEVAVQSSQ
jgi:hypothetical protein